MMKAGVVGGLGNKLDGAEVSTVVEQATEGPAIKLGLYTCNIAPVVAVGSMDMLQLHK